MVSDSPLQLAALEGNVDLVGSLKADHQLLAINYSKANVNINSSPPGKMGQTALQGAAAGGYCYIVRRLCVGNADVNTAPSELGKTAPKGAVEHGRIDIMQLLLNTEVKIEGVDGARYHRALDFTAQNEHHANYKLRRSYHDYRSVGF